MYIYYIYIYISQYLSNLYIYISQYLSNMHMYIYIYVFIHAHQAFYRSWAKHSLRMVGCTWTYCQCGNLSHDSARSCTMLLSPLFFSERTLSSASLKGHFEQQSIPQKPGSKDPKDLIHPLRRGVWGKSSWSSGKDLVSTSHSKIKWAMNCKFYMGLSNGNAVSDSKKGSKGLARTGIHAVPVGQAQRCKRLTHGYSKLQKLVTRRYKMIRTDTDRGKYKKCISQARRSKQCRTWPRAPTNPGWHLRLWRKNIATYCYCYVTSLDTERIDANSCE